MRITQKDLKHFADIASKTASVLPFEKDTQNIKKQRIKKATGQSWQSFSYFCQIYFPHIFKLDFCDAHKDLFETVEDNNGVITITGFRGLGKTVLMGVIYPIWKIIHSERYIIHTASDSELAEERTAFTFNELQNNKRLLSDFDELYPTETTESDFYLKNKARIRSRGIKQSFRGTINPRTSTRPGLIICDDIDKEENIGNESIGRKRLDKITQELGGCLDPSGNGKIIWLGNLVHPNYAICQFEQRLNDKLKQDNTTTRKESTQSQHLFTEGNILLRFPLENGKGESIWQEQYPSSSIPFLRQKFGFTGYQREFLGKPVIEGNIFKHLWFQKYHTLPKMFKKIRMYADPAWGQKGCFKAIIAIGYDGFKFYVIKVWVRQTENSKFFAYFYDAYNELFQKYKYRFRASMETNFGQDRILKDFDLWCKDNNRFPISLHISKINNDQNKNLRIERTDTVIETAKVVFPDNQDTPTLINQFLTYPQGYIDGPDAVAGCLERFSEYDTGKNRTRVRGFRF